MSIGVESFSISTVNLAFPQQNKRFFENYKKALGLNQANMLLKLLYSVKMFNWIENGKYITAITKSFSFFE